MTEFVGLNPAAATKLATSLKTAAEATGPLKSALSAGIAEAGAAFPSGAKGAELLGQCATFLGDSERDLKWRIQTIQSVPGARRVRDDFKVADFPYSSADAAKRAGEAEAQKLKDAWAAYEKDPRMSTFDELLKLLKADQMKDPAFAAGFLNKLGPKAYGDIMAKWMEYNKDPLGKGLTPEELEEFKKELGPLVDGFAAADAAGLIPDLRKHMLTTPGPDVMTAMLAAAPQSKEFLVEAGKYLASAVTGHTGPEDNWRLYWFFKALDGNPEAFQALLATDQKTADLLLQPAVLEEGRPPGLDALVSAAIARALTGGLPGPERRKALAHAAGAYTDSFAKDPVLKKALMDGLNADLSDPKTGREAFQTLAKALAARGLKPAALKDAEINAIVAKHAANWLPEIARLAAGRNDKELGYLSPGKGWDDLSEKDLTNLIAGIFQRPEGRETLADGMRRLQGTLDVGNGDLNNPEDRKKFTLAMAQLGGLGSLMVGAVHDIDLKEEERRKLTVEMLILPIDLTIGRLGKLVPGEVQSTLWKNLLEERMKWPVAGNLAKTLDKEDNFFQKLPLIGGLFGGNENGEASDLVIELSEQHLKAYEDRLKVAGAPALSPEDRVLLKNAIQGFYTEAVVDALKKRGG
ncbi:hypothetical protein [Nonomuraea sp. NPDC050310]|uniref:hypothetical protein n=1 Tax=unclassified Nonomuraea TaxID=2593643 RepID=UPI0033D75245